MPSSGIGAYAAVRLLDRLQRLIQSSRVPDPDRGRDRGRIGYRRPRHQRCRSGRLARQHPRGRARLTESLPVGGDVAAVSDRQGQPVRRAAELLDHLEGGGLLTLQPVGVDRVQQRHRAALDQLSHQPQRVVEAALHGDHAGAADLGLSQLSAGDGTLREHHRQPDPGAAAVGGGRGRGVAGRGADGVGGSLLERLGDGHRHPPVLERAGRVQPLVLEVHVQPGQRRQPRRGTSGVEPSPSDTTGVASVTGSRSR